MDDQRSLVGSLLEVYLSLPKKDAFPNVVLLIPLAEPRGCKTTKKVVR